MSPVIPSFSGHGLAMRAAHQLRALAERFSVHLLVVAIYGGHDETPAEEILRRCASWKRINAPLPPGPGTRSPLRNWLRWGNGHLPVEWSAWQAAHDKEARAYFTETRCVSLWVFRFYLLPWAKAWLGQGHTTWVDLDELESSTRANQAKLLLQLGRIEEARKLETEAATYRWLERRFLSRFERIVTASEVETVRVREIVGTLPVETWPNIISVPPLAKDEVPDQPAHLLFIGSLGHFPNREAVRYAALEILPRLERRLGRAVRLKVAGAGAEVHRADLADLEGVDLLGTVEELTPVYVAATLIIVPLQAGGGTRIKILEAFAYRKAVVSTRIGAEGLEVTHGEELLLANEPDEFAECCAELLIDAKKRSLLAAAGHAYVLAHHGEENLRILTAVLPGI